MRSRLGAQRASICFLALLACTWCASERVIAASLPTRDQNPLLGGFGLPMPMPARTPAEAWSAAANLNWASTALVQADAGDVLIVDAESKELQLSLVRRLSDRWSVGLALPYREIDGGSLDGFIDDWHDAFGLPEGARPSLPEDRLWVRYSRAGTTILDTEEAAEGFGDATVTLAYQLVDRPASALSIGLGIKAPTGEDHWFYSSGASDISAIVSAEHALGERWSLSGQAAATWLGDGDLLPAQQRELVWSGHGALAWRAARGLELIAQVDAHTRVFEDSQLDFFDDALVLSLGGAYHLSSGWSVHVGVSEDIAVEQSPDVVFILGVSSGASR
jgi:hypothetical protein